MMIKHILIFVYILSLIAICNNCAIINGTQLDALNCKWNTGDVMCEDRTIYMCWINQKWRKIESCDNLPTIEISIDNEYISLDGYEVQISDFVRCCNE